jgi:predicted enzyme related to lactoylglutathione lyase
MVIIQDPTGATFAAWQPNDHIGAGRVNDPGYLAWNELQTRDHRSATEFYSGLFGWKTSPIEENGDTVYRTIENKGAMNGGVMPMSEAHGDAPSYWLPYFTVESCDGAVEKIKTLGGNLLAGPMEPGAGKIAVVSDPQGAAFALFEGETDE